MLLDMCFDVSNRVLPGRGKNTCLFRGIAFDLGQ